MTEKELQILEMQAPSTRKCLERSPDLDLTWLRREIPKDAQVIKEDGSVDLNVRSISAGELYFEDKTRLHRGQRIEERHQIKTPSVMPSIETREAATQAFVKNRTVDWIKNTFKELMKDVKETVKFGLGYREK